MRKCFFSGLEAKITSLRDHDGVSILSEQFGEYWITNEAYSAYQSEHELTKKEKLLCLQETVKLNSEGLIPFWTVYSTDSIGKSSKLVHRVISDIKDKELNHRDKEKKILLAISEKLSGKLSPFSMTHLNLRDRFKIGIFDEDEYVQWILYLMNKKLIDFDESTSSMSDRLSNPDFKDAIQNKDVITLTIEGWNLTYQMYQGTNSRNVFIAMAFTDNDNQELPTDVRDTLKTALESDNWKPQIVDEIGHNDGIMDKIIALIHGARFVVAELTHQKSGVYYEAGYAKGRGLPVIHIVKKSDFNKCHFDVKHLNLIVWETLDDLAEKLKNRIKATII